MTKHLILDFETLGQDPKSCIALNCSYTTFSFEDFKNDKPLSFNEILEKVHTDKLSIEYQKKLGYTIEKQSVRWWMDKPKDVRRQAIPSKEDVNIKVFLNNLFLVAKSGDISYWWSRSNTFDPIILWRMASDEGLIDDMEQYLAYYKVRDIRTFIDTKFDFKLNYNTFCPYDDESVWNSIFKPHNSAHDVAADVLRLQKITRIEHELE